LRATRALEYVAIALASIALSVALILTLSGYFTGRDQAGLSGSQTTPGVALADLGDAHLRPGQPRPLYNSDPPTSGSHVPASVSRDGVPLSDDQLLQALSLGDVVLMYGGKAPPAGLTGLASELAGPFSAALAAAGQAVIVAPRHGVTGLLGLAWGHFVRVRNAADPRLRQFAEYWLGRGAPSAR
jgi:hypothetical protein